MIKAHIEYENHNNGWVAHITWPIQNNRNKGNVHYLTTKWYKNKINCKETVRIFLERNELRGVEIKDVLRKEEVK